MMRRNFQCLLTEAPCADPGCTVSRCLERERDQEAEFQRRAERERVAWEHAQNRREAAIRLLQELAAEQRKPRPRGETREGYVDQILALDRYAERIARHLATIEAERAGKAKRQPLRRRARPIPLDLDINL